MNTTKKIKQLSTLVIISLVSASVIGCGGGSSEATEQATTEAQSMVEEQAPAADPMQDKGIGKFASQTIELGALDAAMATKGAEVFEAKCVACHKTTDQKVVGPGLAGVTTRRTPEWILNMITNPVEMTKDDPIAKELLAEHLTQMTFQDVTDEDARNILEYLRQNDGAK